MLNAISSDQMVQQAMRSRGLQATGPRTRLQRMRIHRLQPGSYAGVKTARLD